MALATRCPNCNALFRVAADQLKLRGGLVRCGDCQHAFDAMGTLSYVDDAVLTAAEPAPAALGAVIAAIRKAESVAGGEMSTHGTAGTPTAEDAEASADPRSAADSAAAVKPLAAGAETAAEQPADEASSAGSPLPAVDRQTAAAAGPEPAGSEAAPIQPTGPQSGELATTGPALATETSAAAFLQDSPKRNRKRSAVLISGGAVLLALLLLAQLAVAYRAEILVNFPQARPALGQLCKVFRCTVNWPTRGDLLAVIGTELQALPGTGAFELTAVVRNRGTVTLALPAIELTLSDTLNRIVARKVFAPADYLIDEADPSGRLLAGLEAGADLTIRIAFEAGGLNAAGFVVYPFYL